MIQKPVDHHALTRIPCPLGECEHYTRLGILYRVTNSHFIIFAVSFVRTYNHLSTMFPSKDISFAEPLDASQPGKPKPPREPSFEVKGGRK
jgi:hypothetical protein